MVTRFRIHFTRSYTVCKWSRDLIFAPTGRSRKFVVQFLNLQHLILATKTSCTVIISGFTLSDYYAIPQVCTIPMYVMYAPYFLEQWPGCLHIYSLNYFYFSATNRGNVVYTVSTVHMNVCIIKWTNIYNKRSKQDCGNLTNFENNAVFY